jgi:cullin-associated NEDD8-dissociated protein 1
MLYDPNFHYNSDAEQDADMQDEEEEGWGSDFYDDEQDDDDDTAWKVRKSTIKIIDAIIVSCPSQLSEFWNGFADLLSKRFIERDDNVKCEILETF